MSWIVLSLLSALLLGFYDMAKKSALRDNAVLPVLFLAVVTHALVWAPLIVWSHIAPASVPMPVFRVDAISPHQHLLLLFKSCLVAASWIFGYFALKHLPLSIASPIRATSPLWTILMAVTLMGEMPNAAQWVGIAVVLAAFYAFSFVGKLEGIRFHRNKWVACMAAATLLGACSGVYDKYLLQNAGFRPATVQAWFAVYLVVAMLPCIGLWKLGVWQRGRFSWRWTIPLIGLLLLVADFFYFTAIADPDALIAVVSPLRRASVVVTFIGGILIHKEKNFRPKAVCILCLLAGIVLLKAA